MDITKLKAEEVNLYCGLLKLAYEYESSITGLVCAKTAEDTRNRWFDAIMRERG